MWTVEFDHDARRLCPAFIRTLSWDRAVAFQSFYLDLIYTALIGVRFKRLQEIRPDVAPLCCADMGLFALNPFPKQGARAA